MTLSPTCPGPRPATRVRLVLPDLKLRYRAGHIQPAMQKAKLRREADAHLPSVEAGRRPRGALKNAEGARDPQES